MKELGLNPIDILMLHLDRRFRSYGRRGNICAFYLEFNSNAEFEKAKNSLAENRQLKALLSLSLKKNLIPGCYSWKVRQKKAHIHNLSEDRSIEETAASLDIDPLKDPPFQFGYYKNAILFWWHHAFMDAHGAEELIYRLLKGESFSLETKPGKAATLIERLRAARELKNQIFEAASERTSYLMQDFKAPASKITYHEIVFSEAESRIIHDNCVKYGVELYKSAYYLLCLARSYSEFLKSKSAEAGSVFVPMPRDLRRRGDKDKIFGNQLSPMFLSIDAGKLSDTEKALDTILKSILDNIARNLHRRSEHFFKLISLLPYSAYIKTLEQPTRGRHASFYFSDTGDSLQKFDEFPLKAVKHYPPSFYPPGISFVFSKKNAILTVSIVTDDGVINAREGALIRDLLRSSLLLEDLMLEDHAPNTN